MGKLMDAINVLFSSDQVVTNENGQRVITQEMVIPTIEEFDNLEIGEESTNNETTDRETSTTETMEETAEIPEIVEPVVNTEMVLLTARVAKLEELITGIDTTVMSTSEEVVEIW